MIRMKKDSLDHIKHHYAAVLIVAEDGRLIGQQRDNKAGIDHPGKVGMFGGTVEQGETPRFAAWRELVQEETNLEFNESSLELFLEDKGWRELTQEWEARHFYYVKISDEQLNNLEVYEGQDWAEIKSSEDPSLVPVIRPVINYFLSLKVA